MTIRFGMIKTTLGYIAVAGDDDGLLCSTLPCPDEEGCIRSLLLYCGDEPVPSAEFETLLVQLLYYSLGQRVEFTARLNLGWATPFERSVLEAVRRIDYGQVSTYGAIAQQIGRPRAARAVGQAVAANPLPIIIPCHRVVAARGRLGGFGGGLVLKLTLLRLEGVRFLAEDA
ncbi:MAG: methylated-DNA--[protein]-cysteine S-methyltransferase [Chloroflexi bacterium]|nr:methylated-DNA--[protein]-cysteine S-methyltransferase [Chloroflexota bacterium]